MNLHQLPKTTTTSKPRCGRGYGSGHGGHTSGRGQKGQTSRSSVAMRFEGGQLPLTKRIPWLRGKHRFQSQKRPVVTVNLQDLSSLPAKTVVTPELLVKQGIITTKEAISKHIKILGTGTLEKSLSFQNLDASHTAQIKIKQAGGDYQPCVTTK